MSLNPVTFYLVECDYPECDHCTGDYGDYASWADPEQAREDWAGDNQVIEYDVPGVVLSAEDDERDVLTVYLCDEHRVEVDL